MKNCPKAAAVASASAKPYPLNADDVCVGAVTYDDN